MVSFILVWFSSLVVAFLWSYFFFFKQKTAYDMRISDWSSDVCSSDLPDIFGSMIQAVADDEERGALGMHYTSVPNILKVLNPLFLDDLRQQLEEVGHNARKLLNLRKIGRAS